MAKKRTLPYSPGVNQAKVVHVAGLASASKLSRHYDVNLTLMKEWLSGDQAMPRMLYELLAFKERCELPATAGLFAGWHVIKGERFTGPNLEHRGGLHWSDIDRMPAFRSADQVASRQADLIEALIRERDFYKRQCELESKHAFMLRMIIDGPPKRPGDGSSFASQKRRD